MTAKKQDDALREQWFYRRMPPRPGLEVGAPAPGAPNHEWHAKVPVAGSLGQGLDHLD